MKIGIVGGTGNISQSIVRLLLEKGNEVVCFNRGQTTNVPGDVRLIQGDRHNREHFEQKMQAEKFDAAIDMLCFNAEDAASSIRAFRGVGWFVQTSTTCTYGIQYDYFPSDETHPLRPNTEYGRNKVAADDVYLAAYHREKIPCNHHQTIHDLRSCAGNVETNLLGLLVDRPGQKGQAYCRLWGWICTSSTYACG